ncbi:uncharacterized protein LODBEIA_P55870 [Lodderomyces beijingensis]|uniref:Importin N-terminal domain-containing protein n=1 Tax=Lodderomyces beijingensis TaxID=1775926 RepID=A0ABP0ZTA2_9ASCO
MASYTLPELNRALATMYSNAPREEKTKATHYLEQFQKSQEAWSMTHDILSSKQSSDLQLQLFAAQTLRSKIIYDLSNQMPESDYAALKQSIIGLMKMYNTPRDKLIRTQLSVALSQLALQYLTWQNAVGEIVSDLSASADNAFVFVLLEFLKILPEELSDVKKSHLTDEEYNKRSTELITDQVESVILSLKNLTEANTTNDPVLNSAILDCLNSWIAECPVDQILNVHSLTTLIFSSLLQDSTFDKAVDCLVTIIRETRDIDNYHIIDAIYQQILQLNKLMHENPDNLEDAEKIDGLTRLYVECGESWHALIARNPTHFKPLVEILLEFTKNREDLDVAKYTFQFWYLLKQLVVMPKFEEARAAFSDVYLKLITVIIGHLTYPIAADDNLFDGDKEQEDKFKEFRYEMGDVLKDCCAVVGASSALQIPFERIQAVLSDSSGHWQNLEAPLFSMRAMAKEVPTKEKTILPVIMSLLVRLPEHPKVRYAATLVLGRYTEWTAKHPEYLEPQLNYITKGFEIGDNDNEILMATSQALMYFCQDCSQLLVNYLEQLYMLYGQVRNQVDIQSNFELADGLAHVVSKSPDDALYKTSEMFLQPSIETLQGLISTSANEATHQQQIADQIEVISVFLDVFKLNEFDNANHPVATLFIEKIWPLTTTILSKESSSLLVNERCMKLVKTAILSFSSYLNPILPEIAQVLHQGFQKTHFGCYLWVTGVVIRVFGDEEFSHPEVTNAVYEFSLQQCQVFFEQLFSKKDDAEIRLHPEVIEDFFRMLNDLLMFYPFKLIPDLAMLKSVAKAAEITLNVINEYNPIISCIHFLIDLASWGMEHPPISLFEQQDTESLKQAIKQFLVVDNQGGELLTAVFHGLIFKFHADVQQDANDLILKILVVVPNHETAITWLRNAIISLPNVNEKETDRLLGTVDVALQNKDNRRVRSSLKDFVNWYSRKNVTPRSEF